MRALITGGTGFAGKHLAHYLVSCGDDVAVTYHPNDKPTDYSPKKAVNQQRGVNLPPSVQTLALDVTNKKSVDELINLAQPDIIYHLAAITFVPQGELDTRKIFDVNAFGTINLLEAVAAHSRSSRFVFVSSSEVYGDPRPGTLPLNENAVFRPVSIYGVAKATAELTTFKFATAEGLDAVRARPFPHIGPGQSSVFALSSFAKQVAEIKLGRREPKILVGNLEAKRDYSDVSDIVRGYREVGLNGKRGEAYNLCSGASVQIGEVLQQLIKVAEIEVEVVVDPERLRPIDVPDTYGDNGKALKEFGWKPRIDLEATLHSLFAYWLEAADDGSKS